MSEWTGWTGLGWAGINRTGSGALLPEWMNGWKVDGVGLGMGSVLFCMRGWMDTDRFSSLTKLLISNSFFRFVFHRWGCSLVWCRSTWH